MVKVVDLDPRDEDKIREAAHLLVDAFRDGWPGAWGTLDDALATVRESFDDEGISRIALGDEGEVLGWIGGLRQYEGNVWELHPLVVAPARQGHGIGRALVADFEDQVRARGGITITLGSDDVTGMTTLSGVNLYPDVWGHIASIRNLKHHPYEFYRKLGYSITGVVPDANGLGKPDILMSKRVGPVPGGAFPNESVGA